MECLNYPWFGFYVLMITLTSFDGSRYRHPVCWDSKPQRLDFVYKCMMVDWYRGKIDYMPVIVDYTGMRKQVLPASYNNVPQIGDQLEIF